jgi:uncharacterized protein (TIGR03083 family)
VETVGRAELLSSAQASVETLRRALDADWSQKAGDLDWTCRETLDHILGATVSYSSNLAMRSREPLPRLRSPNPQTPVADLVTSVLTATTILAELVAAAPPDARGFHPLGNPDPSGFAAMGCNEILIHTADICTGLGQPFAPPDDVCARVVARLFPWAPSGSPSWATQLWCNGRTGLPGHMRLGPDWSVQCAPLSEWDGTVKKRQLTS